MLELYPYGNSGRKRVNALQSYLVMLFRCFLGVFPIRVHLLLTFHYFEVCCAPKVLAHSYRCQTILFQGFLTQQTRVIQQQRTVRSGERASFLT